MKKTDNESFSPDQWKWLHQDDGAHFRLKGRRRNDEGTQPLKSMLTWNAGIKPNAIRYKIVIQAHRGLSPKKIKTLQTQKVKKKKLILAHYPFFVWNSLRTIDVDQIDLESSLSLVNWIQTLPELPGASHWPIQTANYKDQGKVLEKP